MEVQTASVLFLLYTLILTSQVSSKSFQTREIPPDVCDSVTSENPFCTADCSSIIQCIDGVVYINSDCEAVGFQCYNSDEQPPKCTRISQCGGPIICAQSGQFPDPDICTKYHDCAGQLLSSTVSDCANDTSYNIATQECDLPTTATVCGADGPVPQCLTFGQRDALPDNPSYYYVCQRVDGILYPALFWCGEDTVYVPSLARCLNASLTTEVTVTSDGTTEPMSTTDEPTTLTTEENTTPMVTTSEIPTTTLATTTEVPTTTMETSTGVPTSPITELPTEGPPTEGPPTEEPPTEGPPTEGSTRPPTETTRPPTERPPTEPNFL